MIRMYMSLPRRRKVRRLPAVNNNNVYEYPKKGRLEDYLLLMIRMYMSIPRRRKVRRLPSVNDKNVYEYPTEKDV